ncbi:MAG: hypothetical protein ACE5HZ_03155 [Fidelibacterota bacterium]
MTSFFSAGDGIPVWILPPVFLLGLVLAIWSYGIHRRRERTRYLIPALLRAGIILLSVVLLSDVVLSWTSVRLRKPVVKVFLDNSVSAAYHQTISSSSLTNGYREIASLLRDAARNHSADAPRVDLYSFGSEIQRIDEEDFHLDFSEPTTHLSRVVKDFEDVPGQEYLAGIVVVTDGQITMGGDPRDLAKDLDVPVHTIGIGELTPMVDIHVEKVEVPMVGVRGDAPTATVFISSVGQFRQRVHVTLNRGKKLLGSKVVMLEGRGSVRTVRFQFRLENPGTEEYRVQVSSLKDEINILNNRATFVITTLKDRFRVALLTGTPSPNTMFLKRVLRRSDGFEIDHFVKLGNRWSPPLVSFWGTNYDVIVLDNLGKNSIPGQWINDLARKLERFPAALAFVAGPDVSGGDFRVFMPLLGLEPLEAEVDPDRPYPVGFSEERFSHAIFSGAGVLSRESPSPGSLPPLRPTLLAAPVSEGVSVQAYLEGPGRIPLFTAGTVALPQAPGKVLRVVTFTSADLWQLHFKTQFTETSDFTQRWWERALSWLAKKGGDDGVYVRLNKSTYQQGETIYVSGSVLDLGQFPSEDLEVTLFLEDRETGDIRSYPLAFSPDKGWEATLFAARPGTYNYVIEAEAQGIVLGRHTGTFRVEESQIELNRVFLNEKLLKDLSEATGGVYLPWSRRLEVGKYVTFSSRVTRTARTFHVSHWLPLGIVLIVFLTAEWTVRRLFGLQ